MLFRSNRVRPQHQRNRQPAAHCCQNCRDLPRSHQGETQSQRLQRTAAAGHLLEPASLIRSPMASPRPACKATPYRNMEDFPDRQRFTRQLRIASLLARRVARCFVRAMAGCGCSGALGIEQEGDPGRAVGWLARRWREIFPPGQGHEGNRSKPPAVAWGDITLSPRNPPIPCAS